MPRFPRLRRFAAQRLPVATRDALRAANRRSRGWADAYEALLAAVEGRTPSRTRRKLPDEPVPAAVRKRLKQQDPPLVSWIAGGESLEVAAARAVREVMKRQSIPAAQSFVDSLVDRDGPAVGHLAAALVANRRRLHALAVHHFEQADEADAWRAAAVELVQSRFAVDPQGTAAAVDGWLADPRAGMTARVWFEVFKHVVVHGSVEQQRAVYDAAVAAHAAEGGDAAWPAGSTELAWVEPWVGAERGATAPAPAEGRVPFAIMDYVQPGRGKTSQNIGDHIQTLASIGHLARRPSVTFHGPRELAGFVTEMQGRVRDELRLDTPAAEVELYKVDRDASTFQAFPERTWMLAFGWHMHDLLGVGTWDYPLHPNLRPILVSFHCNKRGLLTEDTLDYLRTYGPVGCRDWTTVDLLLSLDVPAFFSGCLTTTVSTVFPPLASPPTDGTVYVDVRRSPVPEGHENVRQSYPEVKDRTFIENMREAVRLLEWYRTSFRRVVTTRLHCYLPTRSLGLEVDFEPKNNADVRFNGLFRLSTEDFEAIRTRMIARLEPVLSAILAGEDEETVYALWRSEVAEEVELARARHVVDAPPASPAVAAEALGAHLPASTAVESRPGVTDVVFTPAPDELPHLTRAIRAVEAAASGPLRIWAVGDGLDQVAGTVPMAEGHEVRWVDTTALKDHLAAAGAPRAHDRVLLPSLLPGVDRAVLLPVDGVVVGDVAELAALDLGEHALALRSTSLAGTSGFAILYAAALGMDDDHETAYEFYRQIHARHVFDFDAFDSEVAVLDLARLRADGFVDEVLDSMTRFRLDERAAMHLYVGPHRTELPAEWDHVPTREVLANPRLWHWGDAVKPWSAGYVRGQRVWANSAR